MDPVTLAAAVAIIEAAAKLAPLVQGAISTGQVTPEQQATLIAAQKAIGEAGFTGPEWQVTPSV